MWIALLSIFLAGFLGSLAAAFTVHPDHAGSKSELALVIMAGACLVGTLGSAEMVRRESNAARRAAKALREHKRRLVSFPSDWTARREYPSRLVLRVPFQAYGEYSYFIANLAVTAGNGRTLDDELDRSPSPPATGGDAMTFLEYFGPYDVVPDGTVLTVKLSVQMGADGDVVGEATRDVTVTTHGEPEPTPEPVVS